MRAPIILIALALSACGQTQPSEFDMRANQRDHLFEQMVRVEMQAGKTRAEAEQVARRNSRTDDDIRRSIHEQKQKDAEIAALHAETCRRQPYLDRCR